MATTMGRRALLHGHREPDWDSKPLQKTKDCLVGAWDDYLYGQIELHKYQTLREWLCYSFTSVHFFAFEKGCLHLFDERVRTGHQTSWLSISTGLKLEETN